MSTNKEMPPLHVSFAAMDTRFDVISNIGLWLEYDAMLHLEENEFFFSIHGLDGKYKPGFQYNHVTHWVSMASEKLCYPCQWSGLFRGKMLSVLILF
jgi:hypothetical protein